MRRRALDREIRSALENRHLQEALRVFTQSVGFLRSQAIGELSDYEELRERARRVREEAVRDLDQLLSTLQKRIGEHGGHLYRAADAQAARDYVAGIARAHDARRIVKSKSMTAEEVELDRALEGAGMEVIETDLGERIVQLAQDRPSHLIGPAVHKTKEEVAELFARWLDLDEPPRDADALARLARQALREAFFQADMGITGANFAVAETGTLVLIENEGNIRLTAQLPPVHVAVMGLEKLVRSTADLIVLLKLLPRSATGQKLTSYVSFLEPAHAAERDFHLVVVDNGRRRMRADPELREALYCIRCGACLDSCPSYQAVGGHVYGGETYMGGIGCAWTAGVNGLGRADEFNELCTTCGRCTEVCPVKIDIPWLNTAIKKRAGEELQGPFLSRRFMGQLDRWAPWGSRLAPISNWFLERRAVRRLAERFLGLDPERTLPPFRRRTLVKQFGDRLLRPLESSRLESAGGDRIAFLADCFTNHFEPEVGRAAVRVFNALGIPVELANGPCCGRAALSQGLVERAQLLARAHRERFLPLLERGTPIVVPEPSCVAAIRSEYRYLIREDEARRFQEGTFTVMECLADLARRGRVDWARFWSREGRVRTGEGSAKIVYHGHCQGKSIGAEKGVAELLDAVPGVEAVGVDVSCCGMAGSFGYKSDFSPISERLGRALARELEGRDGTLAAGGASCRAQIRELTGREVLHPIQILERFLDKD